MVIVNSFWGGDSVIFYIALFIFLPIFSSEILLNIMHFSSKSWGKVLMGFSMFHWFFPRKVNAKCFQVAYRTMAFAILNKIPITIACLTTTNLSDTTQHFSRSCLVKHGFCMLQPHEILLFWSWVFNYFVLQTTARVLWLMF